MLSMLQAQLPAGTSTDTVIKGFEMLLYIARIYSAVITFFENKYQMQTQEFLRRFENNELQHTLDFDEWMGEAWMLEALLQDKEEIEEIEFVD